MRKGGGQREAIDCQYASKLNLYQRDLIVGNSLPTATGSSGQNDRSLTSPKHSA